jgi:hypothetical protein
MGYTNYWTRKRAFTNDEWKKVKDEYEWLKEMGEGIIVDQSENKDEIMFNGMAIKGLDHETFCIDKKNNDPSFNFCKTARKPYDLIVWHLLYFIKHETGAMKEISRDW